MPKTKSSFFRSNLDIAKRIYRLVRGYGRRALAITLVYANLQAFTQLIGVASLGPFIAAATEPDLIREKIGSTHWLSWVGSLDDSNLLTLFGVLLVLANLLACVINILAIHQRAVYSNQIGLYLRQKILASLLRTPYEVTLQRNSSTTLNTLQSSTERFANGVLLNLLEILSRGMLILLLMIGMLFVSPLMSLTGAAVIGLSYAAIYRLLEHRRAHVRVEMVETGRGTTRAAQELLYGLKPIRASNAEQIFAERYADMAKRRASLMAAVPVYGNAPKHIVELITLVTVVGLFASAVAMDAQISRLLPTIGLLGFATYKLLPQAQSLYFSAINVSTSLSTLDEIEEELGASAAHRQHLDHLSDKMTRVAPDRLVFNREILLQGIRYRYPNARQDTLRGLELTIPKNATIGICGPSGSGKSTLVDVLLGLLSPQSGSIVIDDTPLADQTLTAWREGVGYVPQDIFLLDDSLSRNVAFFYDGNQIDLERVRWACELAQLGDFIKSLPDKWETKVGDRGVRLSGGQRQRVALARALYRRPQLLVLDEATSALDGQTESAFITAIEQLHGDLTMIIIAHRLNTLRICDKVYRLVNGRLEIAQPNLLR